MEANVHSKNAGQRHSPLQAPPVVLAALGALGTSNSNLSDLRASVSFGVFLAHANVSSIRPETVENGESKCLVGLNRKIGLVQVD